MEALPEELVCEIASWLCAKDLFSFACTCRKLFRIAQLWKRCFCCSETPTNLLAFAAFARNGHAAFVLASRLHFGDENSSSSEEAIEVNVSEAVSWYLLAESCGNATASYNLGCLLDKGSDDGSVPCDPAAATVHFRVAARAGLPAAQNALAINYELGRGTEQNMLKAVFWYRHAAAAGLSDAQFNLAILHVYGRGAEQDMNEALRLFKLAAEKDSDARAWCDRLESTAERR